MQRRDILRLSSLGFLGLAKGVKAADPKADPFFRYGPLVKDPARILNLPKGFHYAILGESGQTMGDGLLRPKNPDGMGAFTMPDGTIRLLCNHELSIGSGILGAFKDAASLPAETQEQIYDFQEPGTPFPGGTTTLVFDPKTDTTKSQWLSLAGTERNCAGGVTPWGSWITCEEPDLTEGPIGRRHGYCFEVKAAADGLQKAVPLPFLGRFRHEAVAVDPQTNHIYLTEDRNEALFYRFRPADPSHWSAGGVLEYLACKDPGRRLCRNWPEDKTGFPLNQPLPVFWKEINDPDPALDNLRVRGAENEGVVFARTEGITPATNDDGSLAFYLNATSGGRRKLGQVLRYNVVAETLEIFSQPDNADILANGDNLTVTPWGDLIICEDTGGVNHLRGVTPEGRFYMLAEGKPGQEMAGACFAPGHDDTLFVNLFVAGLTLAIRGPWNG